MFYSYFYLFFSRVIKLQPPHEAQSLVPRNQVAKDG